MNSLPNPDSEAAVQRQLDAYNAHDIEALVAAYAEDAQIFAHPSQLLASGSAELRARYLERFKDPKLHAVLVQRVVMGHVVIDHEKVVQTFPEGTGQIELAAIYEVQNGRIARAWFINGPKTLDRRDQRSHPQP